MGNRTESYRIITGPSAAPAILPSDARLFHRGHCFGRAEDGDAHVTIGLSSASKVWSNRSSRLPDLIAWCAALARRIEADRAPITDSGLDHLSVGEEVDRLPPGAMPFDTRQIEAVAWADAKVDPRLEYGPPRGERCSVHEFIEARLAASAANVVYYDHGSGEVADFLAITERDGCVMVELFHCKGAGGEGAGDRVGDAYEVCGQAVKSVIHADPNLLLHRIEGRWHRRAGACTFVKGSWEAFRRLL